MSWISQRLTQASLVGFTGGVIFSGLVSSSGFYSDGMSGTISAETPLPAALPHSSPQASARLGLLGWRRKRKSFKEPSPNQSTLSDFGETAALAVFLFASKKLQRVWSPMMALSVIRRVAIFLDAI